MAEGVEVANSGRRPKVRMSYDDRREQILVEATRLIAQSGFNALTLSAVADACAIRKPAVLHYFPSMANLLLAVLARRDVVVFEEAISSRLPDPNPQSCRDSFTRIAQKHWSQFELTRLHKIVNAEALDPAHPAHEWMSNTNRVALDVLAQVLAWKDDPVLAAVEMLSFWEGLELLWQRQPDLDVEAVWNRFCDSFFPHTDRTSRA